ncbi:MAG: hypothetical protein SGI98_10105 [Verrucomicrobiota bacterium]|nr:hypothetical protein [Verrucomicrobiota bacterium]
MTFPSLPRLILLAVLMLHISGCAGPTTVVEGNGYGDYNVMNVPGGPAGERYMENLPQNNPANWNDGIMPYNPDPDPGESMD